MKYILLLFLLFPFLSSYSQNGEYGVGVSCVYQRWKQNFDAAPNISVGVNKTMFTFSSTFLRGNGIKLNSLGGSDWTVIGENKRTFGIGYYLKLEEDINIWLVPVVGVCLSSEILQTNTGWINGQAKVKPSFRIDVRYSTQKIGLGYFISLGNIENGSIGVSWRYK